jgi:4-diphosphocytidyl-2-C-methyl-D-erythritol kinase
MTRQARVLAFAKINFGLRVLYKRPDGYHELRTVFQTISLADSLDISWNTSRTTSVTVTGTPEIPDNIAARAAHLLLDQLRLTGQVRIGLKKKIPSGAGLGGGSSDAAAILLALPVLAGRRVPMDQLQTLAAQLGSDVPFFLYGGRALGIGRGEELYPLPETAPIKGLLVAPAIHSSTADAYRDLSPQLTLIPLQNKLNGFQREIWQAGKVDALNDFESVVSDRHPRLGEICGQLRRLGASPAAMTGSGSALFGIFKDPERLRRARVALAKVLFADDRVFPISFVTRASYRARWQRALAPHAAPAQGASPWPPLSRYTK